MNSSTDTLAAVPAELRERPQWLLWRKVDGAKRPYQLDGVTFASTTNPATWTTYLDAVAAYEARPDHFAGVGFVFTRDDAYVGVDLDDVRDPATGEIAPWAREIIDALDTYAEVSPRGTGVKLWARGELPGAGSGRKASWQTGAVEAYQHSRYFAVTGDALDGGKPIREASEAIGALWRQVFGDGATTSDSRADLVPDPETTRTPAEVAEIAASVLALPPAIQGQNGSSATIHAACEIRRHGLYGDAGRAMFDLYNEHCCQPEWSARELDHKWESARGFVPPLGSEFDALETDDGAEAPTRQSGKGFSLETVDLVDFLGETIACTYLAENAVMAGEHLIIGGGKKSLKTSIAVDLALSLAHATPFLGVFIVRKPVRVLVISGESGRAALQKLCRRIIAVRSITPKRGMYRFSFKRPQLRLPEHLAAIRDEIKSGSSDVCIVDPTYLVARPKSGETKNVFDMGEVLAGFGAIGESTGATMALVHHSTKTSQREKPGMPDLDDLSGSGTPEWARQWILLNRQSPMRHGRHTLAMRLGGSLAGDLGEWLVEVDEGQPDGELVTDRRWAVTVTPWDAAVGLSSTPRRPLAKRKRTARPCRFAWSRERRSRLNIGFGAWSSTTWPVCHSTKTGFRSTTCTEKRLVISTNSMLQPRPA